MCIPAAARIRDTTNQKWRDSRARNSITPISQPVFHPWNFNVNADGASLSGNDRRDLSARKNLRVGILNYPIARSRSRASSNLQSARAISNHTVLRSLLPRGKRDLHSDYAWVRSEESPTARGKGNIHRAEQETMPERHLFARAARSASLQLDDPRLSGRLVRGNAAATA